MKLGSSDNHGATEKNCWNHIVWMEKKWNKPFSFFSWYRLAKSEWFICWPCLYDDTSWRQSSLSQVYFVFIPIWSCFLLKPYSKGIYEFLSFKNDLQSHLLTFRCVVYMFCFIVSHKIFPYHGQPLTTFPQCSKAMENLNFSNHWWPFKICVFYLLRWRSLESAMCKTSDKRK